MAVRKTAPAETLAATPAETLAATPAETPAATPTATPKVRKSVVKFTDDDFDAAGEATAVEYVRGPRAIDVEANTAASVKREALRSLEQYKPVLDDEGIVNPEKVGVAVWLEKPFTSPEVMDAFLQQLRRYGKFKGWKIQTGKVSDAMLRFSVRPLLPRDEK
jgi:hypothetical protein